MTALSAASSPIAPKTDDSPTIVFAGGGSGGHIAPALAIFERLQGHTDTPRCHFICSRRAIDAHMLSRAGVSYAAIDAPPLSLRPRGLIRFAWQLPRSIRQARQLLRDWGADIVLGMGGFVAAPAVRAGKSLGLPTILMNLDRPPGKANRVIARWADEVWTTIDLGEGSTFASRMVGPPVRSAAIAAMAPAECRAALGLAADRLTLLVTGASQGATSINQFITHLADTHADWLTDWQVLHLAGHGAAAAAREAFDRAGVRAVCLEFLDEMGLAWGAADLTISRAGANSVAEVAANAVPTIFLPYPHHADQHQRFNALALVNLGGAVLLEDHIEPGQNLQKHAGLIKTLLTDSARRQTMKQKLADARPDDAASGIAELLVSRIIRPGRGAVRG